MNTEMKNEQQTKYGSCAADIMREEIIAAIRVKMMEQYIDRLIQYSMGTYELEEGEILDFDLFDYIATRPIYLGDN